MFEGRLPAQLADRAPTDRRDQRGSPGVGVRREAVLARSGMNAVAGRRPETVTFEPFRFERDAPGLLGHRRPHRRHGHQRGVGLAQLPVADHRLLRSGVLGVPATRSWAWPSPGPGTTGCSRSGTQPYPDRIIPLRHHLPGRPASRARPRSGATPQRGFRSVTLPERPHRIGLPAVLRGYWDPIIAACVETDTVISLHVGSSGMRRHAPGRCPMAGRSGPRCSASCR